MCAVGVAARIGGVVAAAVAATNDAVKSKGRDGRELQHKWRKAWVLVRRR